MDQKQIKEKYMEIMRTEVWPGSEHMQKYAEKEYGYGVELSNGDIYVIDKPSIKKDFCFGFGMYGGDPTNDQERAEGVAQVARTSEDYFIKENLKQIDEQIEYLRDSRYEAYKYVHYSGRESGSKLKTYSFCHYWDNPENDPARWSRLKDVEKLTEEDIEALIAGYEAVREAFTKRLHTYLKRYGLSKLNVWTYLRD